MYQCCKLINWITCKMSVTSPLSSRGSATLRQLYVDTEGLARRIQSSNWHTHPTRTPYIALWIVWYATSTDFVARNWNQLQICVELIEKNLVMGWRWFERWSSEYMVVAAVAALITFTYTYSTGYFFHPYVQPICIRSWSTYPPWWITAR